MSLLAKLQADLRQSQLARDEVKVSTLRLLLAEVHNLEIQTGQSLLPDQVISIIQREAKKRAEAMEAFKKGGRAQSAEKEDQELKILQSYLPEQLSTEELTKLVKETITEVGATSVSDMGKVISKVLGKVSGRADGSSVSALVKKELTG